VLWFYSTSTGGVDTGQGMASGTSPSIAALAVGGFETAFQANTGDLVLYGSDNITTGAPMESGASPSIAASPNATSVAAGFTVAYEEDSGLYTYNTESGSTSEGVSMATGSNPSEAAISIGVGYQIAYENADGQLSLLGGESDSGTGLAMSGTTSTAIAC
jgi:hypothetical protein